MSLRCLCIAAVAFAFPLFGQAAAQDEAQKAKTKLEAFGAQDGVVIVRGFSKVAEHRGQYGSAVVIEAKEFTNAATGKREYGVTVQVKEAGRIEREHTSYVDLDELASLIQGVEYIAKVDKSATTLDSFQADYRTRGDLEFSTFSSERGTQLAVTSGHIGKTTAFFALSDLPRLAESLSKAKAVLEALRPPKK